MFTGRLWCACTGDHALAHTLRHLHLHAVHVVLGAQAGESTGSQLFCWNHIFPNAIRSCTVVGLGSPAMPGWSSGSEEDGDGRPVDQGRSRSPHRGPVSVAASSSEPATHAASDAPSQARLVDPEVIPSVAFWQKPLNDLLEEYRIERCQRGLLRPIVCDSLCTGMASECFAFEACPSFC
jgi:hypothetical protein